MSFFSTSGHSFPETFDFLFNPFCNFVSKLHVNLEFHSGNAFVGEHFGDSRVGKMLANVSTNLFKRLVDAAVENQFSEKFHCVQQIAFANGVYSKENCQWADLNIYIG